MKLEHLLLSRTVIAIFLGCTSSLLGQQTTSTNCTTYGNTANCTSNTTDYSAQQQRAYEQGQQAGAAIGQGLGVAMQRHAFNKSIKKYCAAHPGAEWQSPDGEKGGCPTDEEKAIATANEFVAHQRDFKACPSNARAMTGYIDIHKLDPREKKSYERAYKDLKKAGQLDLYSHS